MQEDLAGGQLPSGSFGENAAWWAIMILAFDVNSLMKALVLPGDWVKSKLICRQRDRFVKKLVIERY